MEQAARQPTSVPWTTPTQVSFKNACYRDFQRLTPRELVVLTLIARGHSNTEIAGLLFLSPFTIRNRVERILEKLNARNRANAVARAILLGALTSEVLDT